MSFTNEQIIKAKSAKTAEELLAMAKEAGVLMTEDESKQYFAELNKQGELTDDELTSVAGGGKGEEEEEEKIEDGRTTHFIMCPFCWNTAKIVHIFYKNAVTERCITLCGCGAEITSVGNGGCVATFKKDGQEITAYDV